MEQINIAELILVGNELLSGSRSDSHAAFLGRALARAGIVLKRCAIVEDDEEQIAEIVKETVQRADIVIVSGGLGPTNDDVTREGIAGAVDKPLELDIESMTTLESYFQKIDLPINDMTRRQAYFPTGAKLLPNRCGTAAGFSLDLKGHTLFVLPGPPRELQPMVLEFVIPSIQKKYPAPPIYSATFKIAGIGESTLSELCEPLYRRFPMFYFSSLPARGCVDIIVTERRDAEFDTPIENSAALLENDLRNLLGTKMYGTGDVSLASAVGERLVHRGETLSIAESLTGGMLGKRLTDFPGSSRFLLADVVAYSNEAKSDFMGVQEGTLMKFGAVSEQVCREMVEGIKHRTGASWSIATTGIAGPSGGTDTKPVGLCYYGLSWRDGTDICKKVFHGSRAHIRERVTNALLLMLYEKLHEG